MLFRKKTYTEKELIQACLRNDRRAQEYLYKHFFPRMMAMCMNHLHDRDQAMQVVNDSFLKVFTKLENYRHDGSFEGWIRRIVYYTLLDHVRAEKKHANYVPPDESIAIVLEESVDAKINYDDLLKLLAFLPKVTHDVFILFAIEGYKHEEIASVLGISVGTSKWHLSNARKKLRQYLRTGKAT